MASSAEGQIIVISDNNVLTINRSHILDREEWEGEAVTRGIGRAITPDAGAAFRVPNSHQVNMRDLPNKPICIGLRHINQINPLEARRQRKARLLG
jgi:hypothetical protein